MSDKKSRVTGKYWIALSYLDSMPDDVLNKVKSSNLECARILHDKDFNESASPLDFSDEIIQPGQKKKPHYHWIFAFPNTTTENNAVRIISNLLCGPTPKLCSNIRGAYEYFTHKNDPDKYQYSKDSIECYNGFVPENYFTSNAAEVDAAFISIENIIREQDFEEYCDLIDYLSDNNTDLARFSRNHTLHIKAYLQSKNMKRRQKDKDYLLQLQIAALEDKIGMASLIANRTET